MNIAVIVTWTHDLADLNNCNCDDRNKGCAILVQYHNTGGHWHQSQEVMAKLLLSMMILHLGAGLLNFAFTTIVRLLVERPGQRSITPCLYYFCIHQVASSTDNAYWQSGV